MNTQVEFKSHQWFGATVRSHGNSILVRTGQGWLVCVDNLPTLYCVITCLPLISEFTVGRYAVVLGMWDCWMCPIGRKFLRLTPFVPDVGRDSNSNPFAGLLFQFAQQLLSWHHANLQSWIGKVVYTHCEDYLMLQGWMVEKWTLTHQHSKWQICLHKLNRNQHTASV